MHHVFMVSCPDCEMQCFLSFLAILRICVVLNLNISLQSSIAHPYIIHIAFLVNLHTIGHVTVGQFIMLSVVASFRCLNL